VPRAKVAAVPLGVDLTLFTPSPRRRHEDKPATVLFVGGVAPRKGVIHLARAVDALRREGVPCVLNAYGTGDGAYLRLLAPFIASGAMRLEGFVPHDRLPDVYRAADVFAFPTLSDGFGLVVYEAMACGLPVVVSDRCGAGIRDRVNGLVVPHGDDDALAGAIRCLLEDPRLAQALAAEGLATAREASWARYRKSIVTEVLAADGTAKGSLTAPVTGEAVS
jgi:glycosyltransferase involved in cell wall biosynthesis